MILKIYSKFSLFLIIYLLAIKYPTPKIIEIITDGMMIRYGNVRPLERISASVEIGVIKQTV